MSVIPEAVHVHAPQELVDGGQGATSRGERILELAAVLLLSVATVFIAWSGYQAAKWSGRQAERYAQASTARALANRSSTTAGQERLQDLLNFNRWLETSTEGNEQLTSPLRRRFRPEFVPAFNAWLAEDPIHNGRRSPARCRFPQYKLADAEKADRLERLGDHRFDQAKDATENADKYIFGTVFFAAVLFFAGISMRFNWRPMRTTVLVLAACFLAYGAVQLARLPTL